MKHIKGPYLAMRELTTLFFYIAGGSKMGILCNGSKGLLFVRVEMGKDGHEFAVLVMFLKSSHITIIIEILE